MPLLSSLINMKIEEDITNKQDNLMNTNKQSCLTIKSTLIFMYTIPKLTTITDRVEPIGQRHKHSEFIMKGKAIGKLSSSSLLNNINDELES